MKLKKYPRPVLDQRASVEPYASSLEHPDRLRWADASSAYTSLGPSVSFSFSQQRSSVFQNFKPAARWDQERRQMGSGELSGKTPIVTRPGRGPGRPVALRLLRAGANVVMTAAPPHRH